MRHPRDARCRAVSDLSATMRACSVLGSVDLSAKLCRPIAWTGNLLQSLASYGLVIHELTGFDESHARVERLSQRVSPCGSSAPPHDARSTQPFRAVERPPLGRIVRRPDCQQTSISFRSRRHHGALRSMLDHRVSGSCLTVLGRDSGSCASRRHHFEVLPVGDDSVRTRFSFVVRFVPAVRAAAVASHPQQPGPSPLRRPGVAIEDREARFMRSARA